MQTKGSGLSGSLLEQLPELHVEPVSLSVFPFSQYAADASLQLWTKMAKLNPPTPSPKTKPRKRCSTVSTCRRN